MFLIAILIKHNNTAHGFEVPSGWFSVGYLGESYCKLKSLAGGGCPELLSWVGEMSSAFLVVQKEVCDLIHALHSSKSVSCPRPFLFLTLCNISVELAVVRCDGSGASREVQMGINLFSE